MADLDIQKVFIGLVEKIKSITKDDKAFWQTAKEEQITVSGYYHNFLMYLAAISSLVALIQGIPGGILSALFMSVVTFGIALGSYYVFALLANKIGSIFNGGTSTEDSLKWVGYSSMVSTAGSIVGLIPVIGWLVYLAACGYGLYLSYRGAGQMIQVPEDKQLPFFVTYVVAVVLLSFVVFGTLGFFGAMLVATSS